MEKERKKVAKLKGRKGKDRKI